MSGVVIQAARKDVHLVSGCLVRDVLETHAA